MGIIEDPLKYLILAICVLIFLKLFFKITDFFANKKAKAKNKKEVVKETKASEPVKEDKLKEIKEEVKKQEITNYSNYLYDRFVDNPSAEDEEDTSSIISEAFITDQEFEDIKNRTTTIKVNDVEDINSNKNDVYSKIQALANENQENKEKLLEEFNSLSKEMKLLLIENILQRNE